MTARPGPFRRGGRLRLPTISGQCRVLAAAVGREQMTCKIIAFCNTHWRTGQLVRHAEGHRARSSSSRHPELGGRTAPSCLSTAGGWLSDDSEPPRDPASSAARLATYYARELTRVFLNARPQHAGPRQAGMKGARGVRACLGLA
jgi:hypothetical protein